MIDSTFALPLNWTEGPLQDIAQINPKLDKSRFTGDLKVSFVPMLAVEAETGLIDVSETRQFIDVKKGYTAFRERDVLFAKITPCMENGKMAVSPALVNNLGFGSTEFHVIRPFDGVIPEYIYYFVSSQQFRFDAEHNMTGAVGQRRVPTQYLSKCLVPIAPTRAQHRIVAKIEELFSELDKGIESLKIAREQLKIYRQAVLKHAFEGKLTAQWREENKDDVQGSTSAAGAGRAGAAKLETANQLLVRIQKERENRYEQQLEEWKVVIKVWEENDKPGKKPSRPRKPASIHVEDITLPDLPNEWAWEYIGNLNADVFDGPFGSNLKTSDYVDKGVRVIRLENIGYLEFIEEKHSYVTEEKYESIKKHTVSSGDIIFSSFITDGNRVAILPESIERAVNKADCFCVRLHGATVRNDFVANFLSTRSAYKQVESDVHGIGRPRINTTQLKSFVIPICSREEQNEIMSQLGEKLSLADNIATVIEQETKKCETLRQSILKKAFSGQLVEQDPNDEPASVLLERIKAEKENPPRSPFAKGGRPTRRIKKKSPPLQKGG